MKNIHDRMSGHTPGPWTLMVHTGDGDEPGPGDDWGIYGGGIAICFEGLYNPNAKADARLIAAAPALLAALESIPVDADFGRPEDHRAALERWWTSIARHAIKAATGELR